MRDRGRSWVLVLAAWAALVVLNVGELWLSAALGGMQVSFVEALARIVPFWGLWALMTTLVIGAARRVDRAGLSVTRGALVHLAIGFGVAVLHTVLYVPILVALVQPALAPTVSTASRQYLLGNTVMNLLTYGAIVGAYYGVAYFRRYRERELATAQLEAGLSQARLDALRLQLRPHFLFNALNTISVLMLKGDRDLAISTLALLGDLLRATLADDHSDVTLAEELVFLQRYMDIERTRFGDRLSLATDVPSDASLARVPRLILQPLLENAIRHGIDRLPGAGRIVLTARREGDRLRIEVRDNGAGLGADDTTRGDGIGLANTRARLAYRYGPSAAVTLEPAADGGAVARLEFPYVIGS